MGLLGTYLSRGAAYLWIAGNGGGTFQGNQGGFGAPFGVGGKRAGKGPGAGGGGAGKFI